MAIPKRVSVAGDLPPAVASSGEVDWSRSKAVKAVQSDRRWFAHCGWRFTAAAGVFQWRRRNRKGPWRGSSSAAGRAVAWRHKITNIPMSNNNHSLCSILDANKLIGPNFLDWYKNLTIVLK
ncbi:hypothetical protein GH714_000795 [Hevea brasiliensis]|uniref:Uncharacterized protein n=1 Tax=Hevea brasiliensis TaxID=3981 RepID=A0A6A6KCY2_HEVBR|nr:hypothetical protein GH714_000795 [Hevea brasiliensis]